jgi:hypothetical protein
MSRVRIERNATVSGVRQEMAVEIEANLRTDVIAEIARVTLDRMLAEIEAVADFASTDSESES